MNPIFTAMLLFPFWSDSYRTEFFISPKVEFEVQLEGQWPFTECKLDLHSIGNQCVDHDDDVSVWIKVMYVTMYGENFDVKRFFYKATAVVRKIPYVPIESDWYMGEIVGLIPPDRNILIDELWFYHDLAATPFLLKRKRDGKPLAVIKFHKVHTQYNTYPLKFVKKREQ